MFRLWFNSSREAKLFSLKCVARETLMHTELMPEKRTIRDRPCVTLLCRRCGPMSSRSIEFKTNFHADLHVHRLAVLHSRLKAPLLYCFNRSGIQSKSQAAYHANIPRMPLLIDN